MRNGPVFLFLLPIILFALAAIAQVESAPSPVNSVSVASWTPLAELAASQNENASNFGQSVSVSGNAAVVGSDGDANFTGAAYVFVKPSGAPAKVGQTAKLTASDGEPGDAFGYSVSMSGNVIAVGAPFAEGLQGKVYVFVKPPSGWTDMTETAQLTASDGQASDQFGTSVSISGNTIVAGAPLHQVGSNEGQGAVYVFVQPASGWTNMTQTAELTASDGATNSRLGFSIAISGNAVVAGEYSTVTGGGGGTVYVFVESAGGWANMTQTAELTDAKQTAIGFSVAISGSTIVTGSPTGRIAGLGVTGAADVYVRPGTGWKTTSRPTATLSPSDGLPGDQFGSSISTTGNTVIVGAPRAHCVGRDCEQATGIAYAFAKPMTGWVSMAESQQLPPSDGKARGLFGVSVAANGPAVLVGATGTNTAYVYHYNPNSGFTAFSVPGSTSTHAFGINSQGQIVGTFANSTGCQQCGFLDSNGTFTTIMYPGATETAASGINDTSEIVGWYVDTLGVTHGFTDLNAAYTSIDYPGGVETSAQGVNNLGDVVGLYSDASGNTHGFLYTSGVFTEIDAPGAQNTVANGINKAEVIVGSDCAAPCTTGSSGFVFENSSFTSINVPGAMSTGIYGIDVNQDLAGFWVGQNPAQRGAFVFWAQAKQFEGFNVGDPGTANAYGISDSGEIVGSFNRGTTIYGFYGHLPGH